MARKRRGISAWLVTWEHATREYPPAQRVAAILSPRLGSTKVKEIVELIYANAQYTLAERVDYVRKPKSNPYRAEFGEYQGVRREDQITCGHHPFLEARLVDDFFIETKTDGAEVPHWTERPQPDLSWIQKNRGVRGASELK